MIQWAIGLGLLYLAACARKKEESCFVETPEGKKSCDPVVVLGPEPAPDTDGDGVPDDKDLCPNEPHIGSPDGCAPPSGVVDPNQSVPLCDRDSDGDGLSDCDDQCPTIFGIPEASGCTEATYPLNLDYFRLVPSHSETVQLDTLNPCVHLYHEGNAKVSLLWSNGRNLKWRHLQQSNSDTVLFSAQAGDPDINLCPLRKALAVDPLGKIAALWQQGSAGELAQLYFQRFQSDGQSVDSAYGIDSFPMPNLGVDGDFKIASLALQPNNDASVAWVNRDKVLLQTFPSAGGTTPAQLINTRSIQNPRNINPDLMIDRAGNMALVWQEGTSETGPIQRAILEANRPSPETRFVERVADEGRLPSVAIAGGLVAYGWENLGIRFMAEEKSGGVYVGKWPAPFLLSDPIGVSPRHPSVLLDDTQRLVASWLSSRSDSQTFRVQLGDFANYEMVSKQTPTPSTVIDEAAPAPWTQLMIDPSQRSVALLYPSPNSVTWHVEIFDWLGTQAPIEGASIMIEPDPLVVGVDSVTGKITPAVSHWRNYGLQSLEISWELSSGFFIQREESRFSSGADSIASATGKVNMVVSETSAQTGNLTLRTNDPRQSVITIPISVTRRP